MTYYENFKKHSTYDFALNGKKRFDSNVTLILRYQLRVFFANLLMHVFCDTRQWLYIDARDV